MISVISPIYNEGKSLHELHSRLVGVLKKLNKPYEIIFIDDGSTDDSLKILKSLSPAIVISFTRNFGKSQALQAGFDQAKGDIIITLDSDLQDDPVEIPRFIEKIEQGFDLVCGWKKERHDSFSRRLVSRIANTISKMMTKVHVHDMNCGFKAYKREALKSLHLHGDLHRYIPALLKAEGYRIDEIVVKHHPRLHGVSKYGFGRVFAGAFDFATILFLRKFIDRPLHFFGAIGALISLFGFACLTYLTILKFGYGELIGNRPLLLLGILLVIIGFQTFSVGFIGDLIIKRTNEGAKKRYNIRSVTSK